MIPSETNIRIFSAFSIEELTSWSKRLKYFRPLADEYYNSDSSDNLVLVLRYNTAEEFKHLLTLLKLELRPVTEHTIRSKTGQSMSATQLERPEFEIDDVPGFIQPGICQLNRQYVFLWAGFGRLKLTISTENGPPNSVVEGDVRAAEEVEKVFEPVSAFIIDPPYDTPNCFCPKYYPNAF